MERRRTAKIVTWPDHAIFSELELAEMKAVKARF
jgi:hypothetical protein